MTISSARFDDTSGQVIRSLPSIERRTKARQNGDKYALELFPNRFDRSKNAKAIQCYRESGDSYSLLMQLRERLSHAVAGVSFHAYRRPLRWLIVFSPEGRKILTEAISNLAKSRPCLAWESQLNCRFLLSHPLTKEQRALVKSDLIPTFHELIKDLPPGTDEPVDILRKMTRPLCRYKEFRNDVVELMEKAKLRAVSVRD